MREHRILSGKRKGTYIVYENDDDFIKNSPVKTYKIWGEGHPDDYQVGDYVKALDGIYQQIIAKYRLAGKSKKTGKNYDFGYIFVFPNGSARVYIRKNGEIRFYNYFGNYTKNDKYSFTSKDKITKYLTSRKMKGLIASLLMSGMHPYDIVNYIYKLNNGYNMTTYKQILNTLAQIIQDEDFMKEISKQNQEFFQKLTNDPTFSDEQMINFIKDFIKNVKKGSQTHLNSIIMLLKLTQKIPEDFLKEKKSDKNQIEDAYFEEIPPEQLPPPDKS